MKKINGRDRWQVLARRAVSQDRRINRVISNEWQGFNKKEIDLLFQLEDTDVPIESLEILQILQNGSSAFLKQCLFTSMGEHRKYFEERFLPLFHRIEKWTVDGLVMSTDRNELVESLLLHLVENEDVGHLQLLLSKTSFRFRKTLNIASENHDTVDALSSDEDTRYPQDNNIVLINACNRNNFDLVRILILAGYR